MKPTILRYPIPGNEHGGLLHVYGNGNARNAILYCGGWPDGVEPFTPLAQRLATPKGDDDECCLVGITCWPGFDYESFCQSKFRGFRREGFNFDEVTCCIREAAKLLFAEYNKSATSDSYENQEEKKPRFTVIFHDFGVLPGLMFVNRAIEEDYFTQHKPDRVILLDVLLGPHPKFDRRQTEGIVPYTKHELLVYGAYRGSFACSYTMLRYISEIVGVMTIAILGRFVRLLRLSPLRWIDRKLLVERKMNRYHLVYTFYPYYYLLQPMFYNKRALAHASLPLDLVQTPILYIYGTEKNVMFHDHRSLAILEREEREGRSDCRVVKVEGAGHWMYCQQPDVCEQEIRNFLRSGGNALDDETDGEWGNLQSKL